MTYRDPSDHAQESSSRWRNLAGMIRRMRVKFSEGTLWQLAGIPKEDPRAEVFPGIGIYARPPKSGSPEVIVVQIGGAKSFAVAALRDEVTRQAVAGGVGVGETMIYTDKVVVFLRANNTVEIRSAGGVALPLATKADVALLATFVNGLFVGGVGSAVIPPGTVPQPTGTTVLRAE